MSSLVDNCRSYRKYLPEYETWSKNQDLEEAKRQEYLKQNPDKINPEDVQRGKILLHAIDVMDEYSQSNAEDMEVATEFATSQVVCLGEFLGMGAGYFAMSLKKVQNLINKLATGNKKMEVAFSIIPSVVGMLVGTAASFPAIAWATKAKVSSSRRGRFEAMNKDLSNPAIFAVLTPEQQKIVDEKAEKIQLDKNDKKRQQSKGMGLNPLDSIKTLKKLYKGDAEYQAQKEAFEEKLNANKVRDDVQLTEKQIRDAKRDKQILASMVRRIDIASQDYAENAELATNTLTTLALGTGGLVGWLSSKLMKAMKVKGGIPARILPWAVGAALPLGMGIYAAKVQKQASRIGRFKEKQEMLKNPESLAYVDEKDIASMKDVKPIERPKKNIFKFFLQMIKDNKEYNAYTKNEGLKELKRHKALEEIKLSEEQLKEAKNLQMNVFKTFNKVDEKSQTYSESVEAVGNMTKQGFSLFGSLAAMGISLASTFKLLDGKNTGKIPFEKLMTRTFAPFVLLILPIIGIDIYTTKAQKKASRVADMLALKEFDDYKKYVDYTNSTKIN